MAYEWRWDGPNRDPDCECPCGQCLYAIGHDPETPCTYCPVHGDMTDAELAAEWQRRNEGGGEG